MGGPEQPEGEVMYKYLLFSLLFMCIKVLKSSIFQECSFFGHSSLRIPRYQSESDQTYKRIFEPPKNDCSFEICE